MNVLQVFPNMVGLIGLSGFVATVARARITREVVEARQTSSGGRIHEILPLRRVCEDVWL